MVAMMNKGTGFAHAMVDHVGMSQEHSTVSSPWPKASTAGGGIKQSVAIPASINASRKPAPRMNGMNIDFVPGASLGEWQASRNPQ